VELAAASRELEDAPCKLATPLRRVARARRSTSALISASSRPSRSEKQATGERQQQVAIRKRFALSAARCGFVSSIEGRRAAPIVRPRSAALPRKPSVPRVGRERRSCSAAARPVRFQPSAADRVPEASGFRVSGLRLRHGFNPSISNSPLSSPLTSLSPNWRMRSVATRSSGRDLRLPRASDYLGFGPPNRLRGSALESRLRHRTTIEGRGDPPIDLLPIIVSEQADVERSRESAPSNPRANEARLQVDGSSAAVPFHVTLDCSSPRTRGGTSSPGIELRLRRGIVNLPSDRLTASWFTLRGATSRVCHRAPRLR
jgi:hypothetical protein